MHEIREHMKVVDKDSVEVGIVDEVEVSRLKLEKGFDNQHHYVDKELVAYVEGKEALSYALPRSARQCASRLLRCGSWRSPPQRVLRRMQYAPIRGALVGYEKGLGP